MKDLIQKLEGSLSTLDTAVGADDSAQQKLMAAQAAADATTKDKLTAFAAVKADIDALLTAIQTAIAP